MTVTDVPTGPEVGDRVEIDGGLDVTVKAAALLLTPPTIACTFTLPFARAVGTVATICVLLQLVTVAWTEPIDTQLLLCVDPKFVPVTVTDVPTAPDVGATLAIDGMTGVTSKDTALLDAPPTITCTFTLPLARAVGTVATICALLQLVTVAWAEPTDTQLLPWVAPKFEPVIVKDVPGFPEEGAILAMPKVPETVKMRPLLL